MPLGRGGLLQAWSAVALIEGTDQGVELSRRHERVIVPPEHPLGFACRGAQHECRYRQVRRAGGARDPLLVLRQAGWTLVRTKGDHEQWLSPDSRVVVTVAGKDSKDVPAGTLKSIRQSTGLEELR